MKMPNGDLNPKLRSSNLNLPPLFSLNVRPLDLKILETRGKSENGYRGWLMKVVKGGFDGKSWLKTNTLCASTSSTEQR